MTADQQLERSVLESKEREELHAIAQALSVKTNSRTKKADIIDGILKAAGVAVSGTEGDGKTSTGTTRSNGGRAATGSANGASATGSPAKSAVHSFGPSDDADRMDVRVDLDEELGDVDSGSDDSSPAASADGSPSADRSAAQVVTTGGGHHDGGRQGGQGGGNQARQNRQNRNQGRNQRNGPGDDAGNRRSNRRRRGRDRQGSGDGDLQGSGAQDQQYQGELIPVRGLLDLRDEGYGFLRCEGYLPSSKDVYVSISQARRLALRKGDSIEGFCRPAGNTEKFPALLQVERVSGLDPEVARNRPRFEDLTPLFPDERLNLETPGDKDNMTARIVDLLSPIGKGQRGLIVSPPKAGKTTVMKQVAHSIEANNPDVHLMVLLVDERPEEVTDMRRSVQGEVVASTFDRPSEEHTAVTELAIERAKRLVETGRDVVIILDGITRLARAYNLAQPATGRIMSGGVDSGALYPPKKFFGAARNIEEGGSLTILATALVETGSKMDEVIFEEFKGTGNMELRLDRRLSERRLYPSIDVNASSTRHEELLFDRSQLQQVWKLRRVLNALANEGSAAAGLELLMDKIRTTKSNDEFLAEIAKGPAT
jgi:transcription termination factor Rho